MKILDIDMDYFLTKVEASIAGCTQERLDEEYYGNHVWKEEAVRNYLENNLGLSKDHKIPGRIVVGHNEALFFWQELIEKGALTVPFEVIHIDSHADLGLGGCSAEKYIRQDLLSFPVGERPGHSRYVNTITGKEQDVGIGDYLLYAIAYRWVGKLTYCGNPNGECNDYPLQILKDMRENFIWDRPVMNTIQLLHNPNDDLPYNGDSTISISDFIKNSRKEPDVPFLIIPTVKDVQYNGDFDFAVLAQSPNYTPASADFIMDIFREYIEEI